jgi:ubiquinone/menaquinone biosynthesis C-methylase UbiE
MKKCFEDIQTILEVGCGTGHFTRWFCDLEFQSIGLDISHPMLKMAKHLNRSTYIQGDALMLPFSSNSFDIVAMITALEFMADPFKVLSESLRVARHWLILGVINRQSRLGRKYKNEGGPIWSAARFFTPSELNPMFNFITRNGIDIVWRTTLWLFWRGPLPLPWDGFIGMAVRKL